MKTGKYRRTAILAAVVIVAGMSAEAFAGRSVVHRRGRHVIHHDSSPRRSLSIHVGRHHRPSRSYCAPRYSRHRGSSFNFGLHFNSSPRPVIVEEPVVVTRREVIERPVVVPEPVEVGVLGSAVISRESHVAPKEVYIGDGIAVKMKDADDHPVDADIEVYIGDEEYEYEDLLPGTRIEVVGLSGGVYNLVLTGIEPEDETVYLAVE